jgi:hypothetical protein
MTSRRRRLPQRLIGGRRQIGARMFDAGMEKTPRKIDAVTSIVILVAF